MIYECNECKSSPGCVVDTQVGYRATPKMCLFNPKKRTKWDLQEQKTVSGAGTPFLNVEESKKEPKTRTYTGGISITPELKKKANILKIALEVVNGERAESYGDPKDMARKVSKMWSAVLNTEVTEKDFLLCMVLLKVAREANNHKEDNLVDIAGYAEILNRVLETE